MVLPHETDICALLGNYDVSKMHYEGPSGTPGGGYAYETRVEGKSSANPPPAAPEVAAAA